MQALPGWSSVHRARRTWHTWTTGPTRRGAKRSKTPASFRSLPTATLVGTPPWPRVTLTLCSFLLPSLHAPILLSLSLCLWLLGFSHFLLLLCLLSPSSGLSLWLCTPCSLLLLSLSLVSLPDLPPTGLLFVTNIDSSDPDQLVYKTLDPADRLTGPAGDLTLNSYLGL